MGVYGGDNDCEDRVDAAVVDRSLDGHDCDNEQWQRPFDDDYCVHDCCLGASDRGGGE